MKNPGYKKRLLTDLEAIEAAVARTNVVRTILNRDWADGIRADIRQHSGDGRFESDKGLMFFELRHRLRGVKWFEEAQAAVLRGEGDTVDEQAAVVLGFLGLDPLVEWLPELDARLCALSNFPTAREAVEKKLNQLRAAHHLIEFRNHLFESLVLGYFAQEGVLTDVEPSISGVDAVVHLAERDVFVEVTFTSQELLDDAEGAHSVDMKPLVDQVTYKVNKKVINGRQIAKVEGAPALLVLGLNWRGASDVEAQMALVDIFEDETYEKMSGTVINPGWKFRTPTFFANPGARVPFTPREAAFLREQFSHPVPPVLGAQ